MATKQSVGQSAGAPSLKARFQAASQAVEARFADKPWWMKLLVFAPALFVFTALLMIVLWLFSFGLTAIQTAVLHH